MLSFAEALRRVLDGIEPLGGERLGLRAAAGRVLARDVSVTFHEATNTSIQNQLRGHIQSITPDVHPSQVMVVLKCGAEEVLARVTKRAVDELSLQVGQPVWAQVKSVALVA